jgi:hypothetical protein
MWEGPRLHTPRICEVVGIHTVGLAISVLRTAIADLWLPSDNPSAPGVRLAVPGTYFFAGAATRLIPTFA